MSLEGDNAQAINPIMRTEGYDEEVKGINN